MSSHPPEVRRSVPDPGGSRTENQPQTDNENPPVAPESNTGRKFPCPGCGAKLDFDPSARAMKCPYCGYLEKVESAKEEVRERDWGEYWKHAEESGATIDGRSSEVKCKACAAVVLLEDRIVTDKCPYCGNDLENQPVAAKAMILPEGILPFRIDLKRAKAAFNQWIGERWFAPSDLKHLADVGHFNGIYVPFWTYDTQTYTHYTGQRGDNYQELETYVDQETYTETDSQGQTVTRTRPVTKTRMVTKIRWSYAEGNVDHFFDDVLVCASHSIPEELIRELEPWDLQNVEPFQPAFLAGFQTERYTVDLKGGFELAKKLMEGEIQSLCCQDIGGDHQRVDSMQTRHTEITFKHILQPVWLAPYRYRDKLYRIAVNARTGEVVGTRPYSVWKIVLLVVAILAAIGAIALVANSAHGAERPLRPVAAAIPAQSFVRAPSGDGRDPISGPIAPSGGRSRPTAVFPLTSGRYKEEAGIKESHVGRLARTPPLCALTPCGLPDSCPLPPAS